MYINNGQNILTTPNFWLAKEYFKQIYQILDSFHHLLFDNQALFSLFLPILPLLLALSSSRSSLGAILRQLLSKIPCSASSIPRLPIHISCFIFSIPRLTIHIFQTKIPKAPINVKTKILSPNKYFKRLYLPILELKD